MTKFNYYIPTKILFGAGKLAALQKVALPGKKAMIVTTAGTSVKKYGYLARVQEYLVANNNTQSVVFDKILPNPIKDHVMEAAELCRKEGCDFIIGLGGGSPIDSAKSIAVMVNNPGDYWDYVGGGSGKAQPIEKPILPIIAITTTAGTGTEADPWTVITNKDEKIGFGCEGTFPVLSIVDPELMLTVPAMLTAYQGFDTFFHSSEGYIANIATPISDMYALKSMSLINGYLARAVKNGNDIEARTQVALGNTLGGMVESTSSCTSEHSMEHAMSAFYPELPHGAGLIMISLEYYRHFASKVPQKFIEMAENMGVDTSKMADVDKPFAFVEALHKLQVACGVDNLKMSDYGIKESDLPRFVANARHAMGGLFHVDPVQLTDEDVLNIYKKSYK